MDNEDITYQLEKLSLEEKKNLQFPCKKVGYVYDPRMLLHRSCHPHVEKPERIMSIHNNLIDQDLMIYLQELQTEYINEEKLLLVHSKQHIEKVENLKFERDKKTLRMENESNFTLCKDTYDNYATSNSAKISANSVIVAIDKVINAEINGAFLAIRPPGHHASSEIVSGFCFYNNVAIGAMHAIKTHRLKKIAIVDWDVHHGNGTQRIFYDNSEVLFISIHRYDNKKFYPQEDGNYTDIGGKNAKGFNINIPWNTTNSKSLIGDDEYLYAFQTIVIPILKEFNPELLFVSCGFDAAEGDPLGGLSLTPLGYSCMTDMLMNLMKERLIIVLEGGYNLKSIAKSSEAIIRTMIGMKPPFSNSSEKEAFSFEEFRDCSRADYSIIRSINSYKEYFEKYWEGLRKIKTNICKERKALENDDTYQMEILNKLSLEKNLTINRYFISDLDEYDNLDFLIFKIGRITYPNKERITKYNKHLRIALRTKSFHKGFRLEGVRISATKVNWYKYEGNLDNLEEENWKIFSSFIKGIGKKKSIFDSIKEILLEAEKLKDLGNDLIGLNLCLFKKDRKEVFVKLNGMKTHSILHSCNTSYFYEGLKNLLQYLEENMM